MAAAAPVLALVAGALALLGALAAWLGLVPPMTGFTTFLVGALLGGVIATLASLVGLFLSRGGRDPQGWMRSLIGLAIALGLLLVVLIAASTGGDAPPINDITTDLEDPPAFADTALVPEYAGRDMSYPADYVPIVAEAYPDLDSTKLEAPPTEAFERAVDAAEALGWEIVAKDGARGAFYAKDETALFRFVDDVVVRIRAAPGGGSIVDVRSKSRDGQGDLGANAARIRAFQAELG